MLHFQKNDKYTSIAIYAFCVLAALILIVMAGLNLHLFLREVKNFRGVCPGGLK